MTNAHSVHFSSASDDWPTPTDFFRKLDSIFSFDLDAAASHTNAKCKVYYTKEDDGLSQPWNLIDCPLCGCINPAHGYRTPRNLHEMLYSQTGDHSLLLPISTETQWVKQLVPRMRATEGAGEYEAETRQSLRKPEGQRGSNTIQEESKGQSLETAMESREQSQEETKTLARMALVSEALGTAFGAFSPSVRLLRDDRRHPAPRPLYTPKPSDVSGHGALEHSPCLQGLFPEEREASAVELVPGQRANCPNCGQVGTIKATTVWLNSPYGRTIGDWVEKAYRESLKGATVVCLLPARTDTRWFHDYCTKGLIHFVRGRIKFGEATNSAPFPSMLVIFANLDSGIPTMEETEPNLFTAA